MSWQALLDCGISSLPVHLATVCRHYGIKTIPYSSFLLWDMFHSEAKSGDGFSLRYDDSYYIIYNDGIENLGRVRFTVAHEIGHILLGHVENITYYRNSEQDISRDEKEKQANIFARDLLMPACVLAALDVTSPRDIMSFCSISRESARLRAKRLSLLNERKSFGVHPLERELLKSFEGFIAYKNGCKKETT